MRIAFVINNVDFLLSHRLEIVTNAIKLGYEVHVISPYRKDIISELKKIGILFHELKLSRGGKNPFLELKIVFDLSRLFKEIQPDIVHLITLKPYLYGGIAARIAKVPAVVSAVAGLGILFSSSNLKHQLLRRVIYPFFYLAFRHNNQAVIFQNLNDRDILLNWGVVDESKVHMIRGSGVDLSTCPTFPEPTDIPIVSFAARLLKDKGVEIFVEASRLLKCKDIPVRFWLIGEPDLGNTNSVTHQQLTDWKKEGLIELFGFRKDIPSLFSRSNIVTLPSFYGEGLPKVLIEAAACGRAVITTDYPGCRDAIESNKTGLLIPIKNAQALAFAIQYLIDNPKERKKMGQYGRELSERYFDVNKVVDVHMKIYSLLSENIK